MPGAVNHRAGVPMRRPAPEPGGPPIPARKGAKPGVPPMVPWRPAVAMLFPEVVRVEEIR